MHTHNRQLCTVCTTMIKTRNRKHYLLPVYKHKNGRTFICTKHYIETQHSSHHTGPRSKIRLPVSPLECGVQRVNVNGQPLSLLSLFRDFSLWTDPALQRKYIFKQISGLSSLMQLRCSLPLVILLKASKSICCSVMSLQEQFHLFFFYTLSVPPYIQYIYSALLQI